MYRHPTPTSTPNAPRGRYRAPVAAAALTFAALAMPAAAQTTLLVTDTFGNKVVRFDYPSGQVFDHFVGDGVSPLVDSTGMTMTPDGNLLVGSRGNDSVQLYNGQTGRFIRTFVTPGSGGLDRPQMMAYGPDGNLYVASDGADSVFKYDGVTGVSLGTVVTDIDAVDIVFGPNGTMFVSDFDGDRVAMFDPIDGTFLGDVDTSRTGLDSAYGMAQDAAGNIYVASSATNSIIRIDIGTLEASIFVFPGVGTLDVPRELAFDNEGNLLVASRGNGTVLRYDHFGNFDSIVISPETDGGVFSNWGLLLYTPCRADFNEDGAVNTRDFFAFLNEWVAGCP